MAVYFSYSSSAGYPQRFLNTTITQNKYLTHAKIYSYVDRLTSPGSVSQNYSLLQYKLIKGEYKFRSLRLFQSAVLALINANTPADIWFFYIDDSVFFNTANRPIVGLSSLTDPLTSTSMSLFYQNILTRMDGGFIYQSLPQMSTVPGDMELHFKYGTDYNLDLNHSVSLDKDFNLSFFLYCYLLNGVTLDMTDYENMLLNQIQAPVGYWIQRINITFDFYLSYDFKKLRGKQFK